MRKKKKKFPLVELNLLKFCCIILKTLWTHHWRVSSEAQSIQQRKVLQWKEGEERILLCNVLCLIWKTSQVLKYLLCIYRLRKVQRDTLYVAELHANSVSTCEMGLTLHFLKYRLEDILIWHIYQTSLDYWEIVHTSFSNI